MKTYRDIKPDTVNIDGKPYDDSEVMLLCTRELLAFKKAVDYWKPTIAKSREYVNRFEGEILTDKQRTYYEKVEEKIVIEPPIAKPAVRALAGQVIKARKSGVVVTERDAESETNADELKTINAVLKHMEVKTNEKYKITDAVYKAFISCYWNVLYYDLDRPSRNNDGMKFKMVLLPWDSCVFGASTIREIDGRDIREMFFFDYRTIADLIDNFPDKENEILRHFNAVDSEDDKLLSSIGEWGEGLTSDERALMYDIRYVAEETRGGNSGRVKVIMHLFPVKRKEEVWINVEDSSGEDFEIIPPAWDEAAREAWISANSIQNGGSFIGPCEREVVTLWMTVFTTTGLMLANEPHWFQENGMLPCSFWLADISNNVPTGPMADMNDDILASCVAEIEYLDDLRKGSGRLFVAREGALTSESLSNLTSEGNKALGAVTVSKDFQQPLSEAIKEYQRQPNTHWKQYAEQRKDGLYENTRINEAMLGAHNPRQSAVAKESEIAQAMVVNARYIDNVNKCWEYHQNLKLKLIPYLYDDYDTIEVQDEDGKTECMIEINAPTEYDIEGNPVSVVNDLTAHKYRFRLGEVDDSPLAKTQAMEDALIFVNGVSGPLLGADPTGTLFAEFLQSTSNPILKTVGEKLLAQAQQSAEAQAKREAHEQQISDTVKMAKAKAELERANRFGHQVQIRAHDMATLPGVYEYTEEVRQRAEQNTDEDFEKIRQMVTPPQEETEQEELPSELEHGGELQGQELPPEYEQLELPI